MAIFPTNKPANERLVGGFVAPTTRCCCTLACFPATTEAGSKDDGNKQILCTLVAVHIRSPEFDKKGC